MLSQSNVREMAAADHLAGVVSAYALTRAAQDGQLARGATVRA
ncbi:hypothetical protein [Streptomyces sp. NBC_00658]